jgi:diguanylate cyclase (GGDEF)-like protein
MNLYGLPEFVAYSMLLGISYVLIKRGKEERLRYWLVGWALIFLHSAIFMLFFQVFPFDVLARGTLMLAGQAFILAAFYQRATTIRRAELLKRMGVAGALNLTFIIASAVCADLDTTDRYMIPFYLLTALGAASTIWLAASGWTESESRFRTAVALTIAVYAIQAGCLHVYGVTMASQWLMCWTYLAVTYFFLGRATKLTLGVLFTALSFAFWGLVFPVYSLLMIYAPAISSHIESEVWNLPKFLAAASMILALLEERIASVTFLASCDELTGLPNRRCYADRLDQAIANAMRNRTRFGLLVIDLNKFKLVNDTLGHQAGDELLRAVGQRFRSVLRHTDLVARTGGDEFTVIVDGVQSLADVEALGEAIRSSLEAPIALSQGSHYASASVGAAIYPDDGETQIALHARADERMYARKELQQARAASRPFRAQESAE